MRVQCTAGGKTGCLLMRKEEWGANDEPNLPAKLSSRKLEAAPNFVVIATAARQRSEVTAATDSRAAHAHLRSASDLRNCCAVFFRGKGAVGRGLKLKANKEEQSKRGEEKRITLFFFTCPVCCFHLEFIFCLFHLCIFLSIFCFNLSPCVFASLSM